MANRIPIKTRREPGFTTAARLNCNPAASIRTGMDVFVARQPIFNRGLEIYGYELLYRSSPVNMYTGTDETVASLQVLSNCLNTFDIGEVVANGLAFINFTRDLLLNDAAEVLSPKSVVVEVLENVPGDSEVLAACHRLHERGYMIAADDICRADQNQPLLEIADFIKVDFRSGITGRATKDRGEVCAARCSTAGGKGGDAGRVRASPADGLRVFSRVFLCPPGGAQRQGDSRL